MANGQSKHLPAQFNRRSLLIAAPAAGVALVAGQAVAAETPMMALFREWMRLNAEEAAIYATDPEGEGPACEAATDRKLAVERQMRDAPKLTLADLGLAVMATTEFGDFGAPNEVQKAYREEARALIGG